MLERPSCFCRLSEAELPYYGGIIGHASLSVPHFEAAKELQLPFREKQLRETLTKSLLEEAEPVTDYFLGDRSGRITSYWVPIRSERDRILLGLVG